MCKCINSVFSCYLLKLFNNVFYFIYFLFRRSLIAVEREGAQLCNKIKEEEKFRAALWKIEKRDFYHSEACPSCGTSVSFKGRYEVAQLQQEKLPAARMRLEGVLRDLQDSYCHHQHAALLAYCQVGILYSISVFTPNYVKT